MLRVVADERTSAELGSSLDEIVREGARRMLAAALEAEVDAYVSGLVDEVDEAGRRLVVRNGHAEPRSIQTGAGPIEVVAPRVNDRRVDEATGQRRRFRSSIIPLWPVVKWLCAGLEVSFRTSRRQGVGDAVKASGGCLERISP